MKMNKYMTSLWSKSLTDESMKIPNEDMLMLGRTATEACRKRAVKLSLIPDFFGLVVVSVEADGTEVACRINRPPTNRSGRDQVRGRVGVPISQRQEIDPA